MQHKVKFHRICMYCSKEYGVKWDYPPNKWNGKDKLLTHGVCPDCKHIAKEEVENAKSKSKEGPREV